MTDTKEERYIISDAISISFGSATDEESVSYHTFDSGYEKSQDNKSRDSQSNRQSNNDAWILRDVRRFFSSECDNESKQHMFNIINECHPQKISLRFIEWFVITYTERNKINLHPDDDLSVDIHLDFQSNMSSFRKKNFDPFNRNKNKTRYYFNDQKDKVHDDTNSYIITATSQLNFFKWLISSGTFKYIIDNYSYLKTQMYPDKKKKKSKSQ